MVYLNTKGDLPPLPPKAHASYVTTPMKMTDTTTGTTATSYSPIRNQFIQNANPHNNLQSQPGVIYDNYDDSINNSRSNIELKELPMPYGTSTNDLPLLHPDDGYNKKLYDNRNKRRPPNPLVHRALNFPYFTVIVTIIDIVIFIVELVKMKQLTGSAFQTQPYLNPMLGPSSNVQIYLGSRFAPCMHTISGLTDSSSMDWPCPNSTTTDTQVCTLSELCNYSSSTGSPNQTWRLLSAMFLHAWFVHILFNMLLQCTMGLDVERHIGTLRYVVVYIISGVSGNLLGLNFAQDGISSTGASGALFGVIAVNLLIFILHRDQTTVRHYGILIAVLVFEVVVCLVLGLLPGLDNFCHIGGFVSGLLLGLAILNDPKFVRFNRSAGANDYKIQGFGNSFSKHMDNLRKKRFAIWIIVRIVAIALLIAWFLGLGLNFTKNGGGHCSWCKYFNCLPVHNWCSQGDLTSSTSTSSSAASSATSPNTNRLFT